MFFCRREPFEALFCEIIQRPVVEREKREQGLQVGRRQQRPTPLQTGINAKLLKISPI